jgi:hypothetical protein
MRIRKKSFFIILEVVILVTIAIALSVLWVKVNATWNDENSWTTENKLVLPSVAEGLGVKIVGDSKSGDFSFSTDYCVLTEIVETESTATLKCSLIPYYYIEREADVPKDWQEKSDILIVVSKNDPEPREFLGRLDVSFVSVSALGSSKIPVSISLKGKSIRKEKSFANIIEHARIVSEKGKQEVSVTLTEWSVARLDKATKAQMELTTAKRIAALKGMLEKDFITPESKVEGTQNKLNLFRVYFGFSLVECSNLSTCGYRYEVNPADKVAYFMYGLNQYDKPKFTKYKAEFDKALYPFYPVRTNPQIISKDSKVKNDWTVFAAYNFPSCPVVELSKNESNDVTKFFQTFVKNAGQALVGDYTIPKTETGHLAWLKRYSRSLYFPGEGWDGDFVDQLNISCGFLLSNGPEKYPELKKKVLDIYSDMLSLSLSHNVELTKDSVTEAIYTLTAYSPYSSPTVLDSLDMREREGFLEKSSDMGNQYVEWKSLFNSLILLYLYEGL